MRVGEHCFAESCQCIIQTAEWFVSGEIFGNQVCQGSLRLLSYHQKSPKGTVKCR